MNVRYVRVGTGVARVVTLTCSKCGREWEREGSDNRAKVCDRCRSLARARGKAYNDNAGTSSTQVDFRADAVPLLVPGGAASLRYEGRD